MANDNNSFTAITACEHHARVHCPFCILCVNNHRENNWSQYGRSEAREVGRGGVGGHIHSEWWWTVGVRDLWFTWWLVEGSGKKHCVTEVAVGFGWLFPLYPHWFWALGEDFQGHVANWGHFWSPHLLLNEREKNEIYWQISLRKCSHWLWGQTLKTGWFQQDIKISVQKIIPPAGTHFSSIFLYLTKHPGPLYSHTPPCMFLLHWQKQPFA